MNDNANLQRLISLDQEIGIELDALRQNINALPQDTEISRDIYLDIVHRFRYLQSLFDNAAKILNGVKLSQDTPNLGQVMETKEHINEQYGAFTSLRRLFERTYSKNAEFDEELERVPVDDEQNPSVAEEPVPETPEIDEMLPEEDGSFVEDTASEDAASEDEKDEKKNQNRNRQQRLTREGYEAEQASQKEIARRQTEYAEQLRRQEERRQTEAAAVEDTQRLERKRQDEFQAQQDKRLEEENLQQEDARRASAQQVSLSGGTSSEKPSDSGARPYDSYEESRSISDSSERPLSQAAAPAYETRRETPESNSQPAPFEGQRVQRVLTDADKRNQQRRDEEERLDKEQKQSELEAKRVQTLHDYTESQARSLAFRQEEKNHLDFSGKDSPVTGEQPKQPQDGSGFDYSVIGTSLSNDPHAEHPREKSSLTQSASPTQQKSAERSPTYRIRYPKEQYSDNTIPGTFQYTPSGVVPSSPLRVINLPNVVHDNNKVLDSLQAAYQKTPDTTVMSQAYLTAMKINIEAASLEAIKAKGTEQEAKAQEYYLSQRKAFDRLKEDIRNGQVQFSNPSTPYSEKILHSQKETPALLHSSYTPDGVVSQGVDGGELRNSTSFRSLQNPRQNQIYTAENPLVVNPAYEKELKSQYERIHNVMNRNVVSTKARGHAPVVSSNMREEMLNISANYLGFQYAKQAGAVVVSKDSELKSPASDSNMWRDHLKVYRNAASPQGSDLFARAGSFDPDKPKTTQTQERTANVFNRSVKLKNKGRLGWYVKQSYLTAQRGSNMLYSSTAGKLYYLMQTEDEGSVNALRGIEEGRRTAATALAVGSAVHHRRPVNSRGSIVHAEREELRRFRDLAKLDTKQLNQKVGHLSARKMAIERDIELLKGKQNLTDKEKARLRSFQEKHKKVSKDLKQATRLRDLRLEKSIEAQLMRELENEKKTPFVTRKQVQEKMSEITRAREAAMAEKYGKYTRGTDRSLKKAIKELSTEKATFGKEISAIRRKGSLSAEDRKKLSELLGKRRATNAELRKLLGLQKDRKILSAWQKVGTKIQMDIVQNANGLHRGLSGLTNILFKPLREGADVGAQGLATAAQYAANPYVHMFVKTTWKTSMRLSGFVYRKTGAKKLVNASAKIVSTGAKATATAAANSKVGMAVKTGVSGAQAGLKTATQWVKDKTPVKVKTAVKKGAKLGKEALEFPTKVKTGIFNPVYKAYQEFQKWLAQTWVGRVYGSIRHGFQVIGSVLSFIGGILAKIALLGLLFFVVVGLLSVAAVGGGAAASTVIMAPYEKDDKIDLSRYTEIIQEKQDAFDEEITKLSQDGDYDDCVIQYTNPDVRDNTREMLSMMAVRMMQNLDLDEQPEVGDYLRSLYDDSHKYVTEERFYFCNDSSNKEYTSRNALDAVAPFYTEDKSEGCMKNDVCDGHHRCTGHNICDGHYEDDWEKPIYDEVTGEKTGYEQKYYEHSDIDDPDCNHYHTEILHEDDDPDCTQYEEYTHEDNDPECTNSHEEYYCPGHARLYIKITIHDFDEIFYADTSGGEWDVWTKEENVEWCKNIYDQEWEDLYTDYTITGITFGGGLSEEEKKALLAMLDGIEGLTANQRKVAEVTMNSGAYGIDAIHGLCQSWVANVFMTAGQSPRWSATTAYSAFSKCHISTSRDDLPAVCTVYGTSNSAAGHVGIYINGLVYDNIGGVDVSSFDEWAASYNYVGWGFNNWSF